MDCDYDEEYSNIEFLEEEENFENTKINLELEPSRELFKWDCDQTFYLIEVVKQHYDKFDYQLERKIWAEIAKEVYNVCGFKVTGDQCDFKFKSLKIIYEHVKLNHNLRTWKFFDALDDLLSNNHKDPLAVNTTDSVYISVPHPLADSEEVIAPFPLEDSEKVNSTFSDSDGENASYFDSEDEIASVSDLEEESASFQNQGAPKSTLLSTQQKQLYKIENCFLNKNHKQKRTIEVLKWSTEMTFSLIDIVQKHYMNFDYGMGDKVWTQISNKMENMHGIKINGVQCNNKFKNLGRKYWSIKSNPQNCTDWEFFKAMDDIYSNSATDFVREINRPLSPSNPISYSPKNNSEKNINKMELLDMESESCDEMPANKTFKWTIRQTVCLINAIKMHLDEYHFEKKKKVWAKIAKEMEYSCGLNVTGQQCNDRLKTMKKKYNRFKSNNKPWKTWRFFEAMENILSYRPTFNRISTSSTSGILNASKSSDIEQHILHRATTPDDYDTGPFTWSVSQTFCLIDAIKNTLGRLNRKRILWDEVASEVENVCGLKVTGQQCDSRLKNLKRIYKKIKLNSYPRTWKYLEALEDMLSYQSNCNSVCITEELSQQSITSTSTTSNCTPSSPQSQSENLNTNNLSDNVIFMYVHHYK